MSQSDGAHFSVFRTRGLSALWLRLGGITHLRHQQAVCNTSHMEKKKCCCHLCESISSRSSTSSPQGGALLASLDVKTEQEELKTDFFFRPVQSILKGSRKMDALTEKRESDNVPVLNVAPDITRRHDITPVTTGTSNMSIGGVGGGGWGGRRHAEQEDSGVPPPLSRGSGSESNAPHSIFPGLLTSASN